MNKITSFISRVINRLFVLLELSLIIRLVLKFLGASKSALVVNFIYKYTDFLIKPFEGIFSNFYFQGKPVEASTLSAIVGYLIILFVISRIINLFGRK